MDPVAGDLDILATTDYQAPPIVSNVGVAIGGQTTDFAGLDTRAATPDVGADEITVSRTLTSAGTLPPASPNYAGMLDDLTLTGAGAPTLSGNVGVSGALQLQGGNVVTSGYELTLFSAATVSRTSGHVVGTLRKYVGMGRRGPITFEVGSGADYAPVDVRFPAGATTAGFLGASSTGAEHPQVALSGVNAASDANRYWTVSPGGVGFGTAEVTLHFVPGDLDAGANTAAFTSSRYDGSNWTTPPVGLRTSTSTQATGLTALGEFVAGEPRQVLITASAGPGGSITPNGAVAVTLGADQAFAIAGDASHHVADVLVDGVSHGPITSYTFTAVATAHTIEASFALNTYAITVTSGAGGSVAPSGTVNVAHGSDQAFVITPDAHYHVVDVKVDGISHGAILGYTFTGVVAAHTLDVTFALDQFTLTASAGAGGSISPGGATLVAYGGSQEFTITPDIGHVILDVLVDGSSVGAVGTHTISAVDANHTIAASFAVVNHTLALGTVGSGTVSPSPPGPDYPYGTVVTLTAHPASGYAFTGWSGDASGSVNPATVTMNGDRSVTATFEAIATAVSATSPGGTIGPSTPTATIPVEISRTSAEPIMGVSVTFRLDHIQLSGPPTITLGGFLSASGGTVGGPFVTDHGDGTYTVDASTLGLPCGSGALSGELFRVRVVSSELAPAGTLTVTSVTLRDCSNATLFSGIGAAAMVAIDNLVPSVAVTSPNGGETWLTGSSHDILWIASDAAGIASNGVDLAYSTNGGGAWTPIANGLANTGSYAWTLPGTLSADALVRVTARDANGNSASDASDAPFSIVTQAAVAVTSSVNPSAFGQSVTFSANVTPEAATGSVSFTVDGAPLGGPIALVDGHAASAAIATLAVGTHAIEATYSGDALHAGASALLAGGQVVQSALTTTVLAAVPSPSVFEAAVLLTATVAPVAPGAGIPGGDVTFLDGTTTLATIALDASGVAATSVTTLSVGDHTLRASYAGAGGYLASESAGLAHAVQAQITATVGAHGQLVPSGVLLFNLNDTPSFAFTADATYHVLSVTVDGAAAPLTSPYTFAPLSANHTIDVQFEANPAVGAIASLASATVKTGNAAGPIMKIRLTWDAVAAGSTVEVYRAPYGNYPEYDDAPSPGSAPTAPAYPPTAPWALTGVHLSGETDTPPARDFYYYVAYVTDTYGTRSPVSNLTAGSMSYALGDVSDGITIGMGDNLVDTADLSLLGAHYGATLTPGDAVNYLDVGPTTDLSVDARPTTDNHVDFEDLMMFAFNYGVVSGEPVAAAEIAAALDGVTLERPSQVSPGAEVTVRLMASGTGNVRAISTTLSWAAGVVEPVGFTAGSFLTRQNGVALSPRAGTVDVAVLGAGARGITGTGELATFRFRVLAAGDPKFAIAGADARDGRNHRVQIATETQVIQPPVQLVTRLAPAYPTPFNMSTTISFSLAQQGFVELSCFSVDGRRVQTLARGVFEPGEHRFTWDGRGADGQRLAAGVYYALLETPQGRFNRKLVIVR